LELKPDADAAFARLRAYWAGELTDRACIEIRVPRRGRNRTSLTPPESIEERWTNVDYMIAKLVAEVESFVYVGEALPIVWPDLGPDFLAATLGCEFQFTPETSWTKPLIEDWASFGSFQDYRESRWYKLMVEMTERLTEAAEGRFLAGITDLHPGGDALGALRGTSNFLTDFYDAPEQLAFALDHVDKVWCEMVDAFEAITTSRGQAHCVGFLPWGPGKTYPLQDDTLALLSPAIVAEFILPGIRRRAAHLDCAMFHLDGPEALDKLDMLLAMPEMHAIQWQPGVSNRPMMRWIPLMKRILAGGKLLTVDCTADQVEPILRAVPSKGLHIIVHDVRDEDDAKGILELATRLCH